MKDAKYVPGIIDRTTDRGVHLTPGFVYDPLQYRIGLINIKSGKAIPEDEPTFITRAQDNITPHIINTYRARCSVDGRPDVLRGTVETAAKNVEDWRRANPEKCKDPD